MFQKALLSAVFAFLLLSAASQQDPFTGSNKIVTKTYAFAAFDKIALLDLDGAVEVEVGKPFSIETKIREKYTPILEVKEDKGELTIVFKYTKDNNKYINDPNIRVRITCPTLASLYKRGNGRVSVTLATQPAFSFSNEGNGSATLQGATTMLTLKNDGNGSLNAEKLLAETVVVKSFGNGDVVVNAKGKLMAERNGNGRIRQQGEATVQESRD